MIRIHKKTEFHKESESAVENAIALQKRYVFKEIQLSLQIYLFHDLKTRKDAEFRE